MPLCQWSNATVEKHLGFSMAKFNRIQSYKGKILSFFIILDVHYTAMGWDKWYMISWRFLEKKISHIKFKLNLFVATLQQKYDLVLAILYIISPFYHL